MSSSDPNTKLPEYSLRLVGTRKPTVLSNIQLHRIPPKLINFRPTAHRLYLDTLKFSKKYLLNVEWPNGVTVDVNRMEALLDAGILSIKVPLAVEPAAPPSQQKKNRRKEKGSKGATGNTNLEGAGATADPFSAKKSEGAVASLSRKKRGAEEVEKGGPQKKRQNIQRPEKEAEAVPMEGEEEDEGNHAKVKQRKTSMTTTKKKMKKEQKRTKKTARTMKDHHHSGNQSVEGKGTSDVLSMQLALVEEVSQRVEGMKRSKLQAENEKAHALRAKKELKVQQKGRKQEFQDRKLIIAQERANLELEQKIKSLEEKIQRRRTSSAKPSKSVRFKG